MAKTVVGVYDSYVDARSAVQDLTDNGFDSRNISLIANDVVRHPSVVLTEASEAESGPTDNDIAQGAGAGALAGGLAGLIVGLSALMVPGIGPILALGPLAGALIGAGLGLVVGGLLGALLEAGIPEQEAEYYAEAVRRGGSLVMVQTDDLHSDLAVEILGRHHAVDVTERVAQWQQQGWTSYNPKASAYTAEEIARERERYAMSQPEPYIPPAAAISSTMPAYQAGVPVPPVSLAPPDLTTDNTAVADVPPPDTPNPPIGRRPVGVYSYSGTVRPMGTPEPPMPMDTIPESDRELVGAKGGEADANRAGRRPDDYQNSDLGGEVSVFDSLTENP